MRLLVLVWMLGALAAKADAYPRKGRSKHEHCGDRFATGRPQRHEGAIVEVARVQEHRGREAIHLKVRTATELLAMRLGPSAVLAAAGLSLRERDRITVVGARVPCNGDTVLLASSVTRHGKTVALRDDAGVPLWIKEKVASRPPRSAKARAVRTSKRPPGAS